MNEGAFAILDCLGFKGAWAHGADPRAIIGFLKSSQADLQDGPLVKALDASLPGRLKLSIAFISDSVIIGAQPTSNAPLAPVERGYLVSLLLPLCSQIVGKFLKAQFPFALRGCITFGRFIAEDLFYLGEAVDEAASFSESSDGAFIWLTPRAQAHLEAYRRGVYESTRIGLISHPDALLAQILDRVMASVHASQTDALIPAELRDLTNLDLGRKAQWGRLILKWIAEGQRQDIAIRYPMPLTSGGDLDVYVLNPYIAYSSLDTDPLLDRYLITFGDPRDLRILTKRQNTLRFLELALSRAKEAIKDANAATRRLECEVFGHPILTDPELQQMLRIGADRHTQS